METKKKSLNEFTDSPRIKVAEQEQLSLTKLDQKLEDKYSSLEKRAYVSNFFKMWTCTANSHV